MTIVTQVGAVSGAKEAENEAKYHSVLQLGLDKKDALSFYLDEDETEEYKVSFCFDYSGAGQHLCVTTGRRMNITYQGEMTSTSTSSDTLQSGSAASFVQSYRASSAVTDLALFPADVTGRKIIGELIFTGYGGSDNFFASFHITQIRQDSDEYDVTARLLQLHKQE